MKTLTGCSSALLLAGVLAQARGPDPGQFVKLRPELLDARGDAGLGSSIVIDAQDRPHIAYYSTEGCCDTAVNYAYQDAAGWHFEVAADSVGTMPSSARTGIALDASGSVHIGYHDAASGSLRHVRRSEGNWLPPETADAGPDVGLHASLALDAAGNPHLSYYSAAGQDLRYVRKSGGGFLPPETVDAAGDVGQYTSLELDAQGNPHISYHDATQGDLRYVRKNGGGFLPPETVDSSGAAGVDTSLELDAQGNPHISSFQSTNNFVNKSLRYARKVGGDWQIETVTTSLNVSGSSGNWLELDSSGVPHIAFGVEGIVSSVFKSGQQWDYDPVTSPSFIGVRGVAMALDSAGTPHITYFSQAHRDLVYLRLDRGWHVEPIQQGAANFGYTASLALHEGVPAIAYVGHEAGQDGVYWTSRIGSIWSPPERIWPPESETYSSLEVSASLALGAAGAPRLSFFVGSYCDPKCLSADDLKFAYQDPAGDWIVEDVVTEGDVGRFHRLVLDSNDVPAVVYLDETAGRLRIARRTPLGQPRRGSWEVLPSSFPLQAESFALAGLGLPDGRIAVSHYQVPPGETEGDLRLALWDGAGWTDELVDDGNDPESPGDMGRSSSLAYDADERRIVVAYTVGDDPLDGHLKLASRAETGLWHATQICFIGAPALGLAGGSWRAPRIASSYNGGAGFSFLSVSPGFDQSCGESADFAGLGGLSMVVEDIEHIAYFSQASKLRYAARTIPPPVPAQAPAQAEAGTFKFMFTFRQLCDALDRGAPLSEAWSGLRPARGILPTCIDLAEELALGSFVCNRRRTSRAIDFASLCRHVDELEAFYLGEPRAAADVVLTLENLWPIGEAVLAGRGSEVAISSELVLQAKNVLYQLRGNGSPELMADVNLILDEYAELESFQGKTGDQAIGLLGGSIIRQVGIALDALLLASICGFLLLRSWWRGSGSEPLR